MATLRPRMRGFVGAVLFVFMSAVGARADEVAVVAHPGTSTPTLTKDDVQQIFTGRKTRWSTGGAMVPVLLEEDPVHTAFLAAYVQKTPAQFDTFWKRQVFTGKSSPLRSFPSEREVVAFVSRTEGAIGYVSKGAVTEAVRVVLIQ